MEWEKLGEMTMSLHNKYFVRLKMLAHEQNTSLEALER